MKRTSLYVLLGLIVVCILANCFFSPQNILSYDVFGYYLYLPLTFNYHDLGLHDMSHIDYILSNYNSSSTFYQGYQLDSGKWVMKYSMGMAVLYAPFYFIANLFACLFGYPLDGFSQPYQISIWIGSVFYTLAGLYILRKVLLLYFSEGVTALTLIIIYLGSNYFFHSSFYGQNAMSHNYLFTLYAAILWLTHLWHTNHQLKHLFFLAVICGLAILSRPTEIVCLIIPLLWGIQSKETFTKKIKMLWEKRVQIMLFGCTVLFIGSWQIIYWKVFTGKFLINSYGGNPGEGLEFFHPFIMEVVFSFRKGWLVYSPIMVFSVIGFLLIIIKNRFLFLPLFLYFLGNLYLVSCWSNWWYAESFGPRALIPSYAVLAIPLGYFIAWFSKTPTLVKYTMGFVLFFLVGLSLFQTWQFKEGIIHNSRMTKAYYWAVFGDTKHHPEYDPLLLVNRSYGYEPIFTNEKEYEKNKTIVMDFEKDVDAVFFDSAYNRGKVIVLDEKNIYSPVIEVPFSELTSTDHAWIRASVMIYPISDPKDNPASLSICFDHKGKSYKYRSADFENISIKTNQWNKITKDYLTPEVRSKKDLLRVLVWFRGKTKLYIDDLQIEVFTKKSSPS